MSLHVNLLIDLVTILIPSVDVITWSIRITMRLFECGADTNIDLEVMLALD